MENLRMVMARLYGRLTADWQEALG